MTRTTSAATSIRLHSSAALGSLVAGQAAAGRAPYIFVWLQSAELLHQVGQLHDKFSGGIATHATARQVHQAEALANAIAFSLGRLHAQVRSGAVAAEVEVGLKVRAHQAESLYEELQ